MCNESNNLSSAASYPKRILRSKSEMPCCTHNQVYRPITLSSWQTVRTMFWIHNETGNIWTHFIGTLMFYFLFQHVCHNPPFQTMSCIDFGLICLFFFGVLTCLFHSTLFHLFSCYSFRVNKLFAKLDYCGITILIGCSFIPWIYYGFYNSPWLQASYIVLTLVCTIICIIFSLFDRFCEPRFNSLRTLMFLADGFIVFVPAIHWCIREIIYGDRPFCSLDHRAGIMLLWQGITYVTGAFIYLFKIPETIYPLQLFNLWFNSHQIFHILVVIGALLYYHSFILIMKIRLTNAECFVN